MPDQTHLKWLNKSVSSMETTYNKAIFIAQLILEMMLTHDLVQLWACPDISGHTHLKWLCKFVAFIDV